MFQFKVQIIAGLMLAAFTIVLARLAQLQLVRGNEYQQVRTSLGTREHLLQPARGEIRTRDNMLVAVDHASYDLAVTPSQLPTLTVDLAEVELARANNQANAARQEAFARLTERLTHDPWVQRVAHETGRTPDEVANGLLEAFDQVARKWKSAGNAIPILRDLDEATWTRLRTWQESSFENPALAAKNKEIAGALPDAKQGAGIPGLSCIHSVRRVYPEKTFLAHILGTLRELSPEELEQLRESGKLVERLHDREVLWEKLRERLDANDAELASILGRDPREIIDVRDLLDVLHALPPEQRRQAAEHGLSDPVRWAERPSRMELGEAERTWLGDGPQRSLTDVRVGESGVEGFYNQLLRGEHALQLNYKVPGRKDAPALAQSTPKPGATLTLTIDSDWQQACEETLAALGKPGAAVIMDVRTGEILAMASWPTFDPNLFVPPRGTPETSAQLKELLSDQAKPLMNRAVSGQYPLGSVMKPFVAAVALENGLISPNDTVDCCGHIKEGNTIYHCDGKRAHGRVDITHALRRSCNIFFYQLGAKVGVERLATYAEILGFGRRTGLDLGGESSGVFPDREWREQHFPEGSPERGWARGKDFHLAIGQGYMSVTPLQATVLMAALSNGGFAVTPHLRLDDTPPAPRALGWSEHTLSIVREGLDEVVSVGTPGESGTAYHAFSKGAASLPIRVAGKTGTADTGKVNDTPHAWFAGYAPADKPKIAFCFFVENGGHGGEVAAPLAYQAFKRIYGTRAEPRKKE